MREKQLSDSIFCGVLLAISGGSMDAYSYLFRDKVFANAQTGNMLLFGVNLAERNYFNALKYLFPIISFMIGIIISDLIRYSIISNHIHWRQVVVGIEALILVGVAFIPTHLNPLANALTSLVCGMQVESFRKIEGNSAATTMCIGNLRSGTENLYRYIRNHENSNLKKTFLYYGIISTFIIGAVIESVLIDNIGTYSIIFSSIMLVISLIYMKEKNIIEKNKEIQK